jgi:Tfp pilus assembly protein PilN
VLRTNLSTRPFYNERAVHVLLALAGLVVVLLTAFNAIRIIALSRQNTELSSLINRDHEEAQRLTREAQRIRAGINQKELEATAKGAAIANSLIDQRTFSWTEFFNHIEETLPPDVMLTSVRPSFNDDVTTIQMTVLGRRSEDLDEFMEKLEATGAFDSVLPAQRDTTEEGLDRLLLEAVYTGAVPEEPAESVPAGTSPPPAAQQPAAPAAKPGTPASQPPAPSAPQPGRAARGGAGR